MRSVFLVSLDSVAFILLTISPLKTIRSPSLKASATRTFVPDGWTIPAQTRVAETGSSIVVNLADVDFLRDKEVRVKLTFDHGRNWDEISGFPRHVHARQESGNYRHSRAF